MIDAARSPSENVGDPFRGGAAADGLVEVGNERIEAVRVALRMAPGKEREARSGRRQRQRVAANDRHRLAATAPELFGLLLVEGECLLRPVELDPQPVLAPRRDLADDHGPDRARVRLELDDDGVLGRDGTLLSFDSVRRERLAARGADSLGHGGEHPRAHAGDAVPGDEFGQVAPVRADVGERPRRSAQPFVHAPVVVVRTKEPVLQIGAVQQPQRSDLPASDALPSLAHRRVVAVDERHAGLEPRVGCGVYELLGAPGVQRERLLADHVLARGQRRFGQREVKVVGRADVDDVDVRVPHQLLGRLEGPIGPELCCRRPGAFGRRGGDAHEPRSCETGRPGVDYTDEPCSCDRRLEGHEGSLRRDALLPGARARITPSIQPSIGVCDLLPAFGDHHQVRSPRELDEVSLRLRLRVLLVLLARERSRNRVIPLRADDQERRALLALEMHLRRRV